MQHRRRWPVGAWTAAVPAVGVWQIVRGHGVYWAVFTVTFVDGCLLLLRLGDRREQP